MERFLKLVRKDIEIIERDSVQPNAIIVCIPQK